MKWANESHQNPGFSVYHATPDGKPNTLFVISYKKKTPTFTPIGWRVFVRNSLKDALRTIYVSPTLKEAKQFAEDFEKVQQA